MNGKRDGDNDFDAFVKRQQPASAEGKPIDWAKERDEWLNHLKELYRRIDSFLAKYVDTGEIKRDYHDIELNEENIGSYLAPQMILKIGRQEVTLTPIGTLLIGTKGRVDVSGPTGRTRFLLVNSEAPGPTIRVTVTIGDKPAPPAAEIAPGEIKWAWKIATRPPTIRYIELTQESLFQALMEVASG
jgi:hypothetical protein